MQSPPPYYAPAPRKSNVGLIVAIIIGVLAVCCVLPAILAGFFGYGFVNKAVGFMGCGWSMEQMRDGLVAYAKANGGKLPAKEHWQEDIAPYLKPIVNSQDMGPFKMPPTNADVCDVQAESGVTYNQDLAGKKLASIDDPTNTIILWETPGRGRDKFAHYSEPSIQNGPKLMGNIPRGWVLTPVSGEAYFTDQNGRMSPIPEPGARMRTRTSSGSSSTTSSTTSSGDTND